MIYLITSRVFWWNQFFTVCFLRLREKQFIREKLDNCRFSQSSFFLLSRSGLLQVWRVRCNVFFYRGIKRQKIIKRKHFGSIWAVDWVLIVSFSNQGLPATTISPKTEIYRVQSLEDFSDRHHSSKVLEHTTRLYQPLSIVHDFADKKWKIKLFKK